MSKRVEMRNCDLTLTTTVEENRTQVKQSGKLRSSEAETTLVYNEAQATVFIKFLKDTVIIERQGDYSLYIPLEKGKIKTGTLGIGGSEGEILVETHAIGYSLSKTALLASLSYTLHFSG